MIETIQTKKKRSNTDDISLPALSMSSTWHENGLNDKV